MKPTNHINPFIYVLAPHLETTDDNINYYYDFSQSIAEYTKIFSELNFAWKWQPVTMTDYPVIIEAISKHAKQETIIVLNLCDGDEVNGTPGISVVKKLEEYGLLYTGADEYFYHITTSKIPMKKAFDAAGVAHAEWESIGTPDFEQHDLFDKLGTPIILKPSVSGGSMGVGIRNVVHDQAAMKTQLKSMFEGYRGWDLSIDGIIAEQYISGREFTTMITGSARNPDYCRVYYPVERVFHDSLPAHEKFLSFDRLWEIYEDESPMPNNDNFYEYAAVEKELAEKIRAISLDAYRAVKGMGYTRVDIRMDEKSGNLYVLEVNAQCGLSEDENFTSIGAILKVNGTSFKEMILEILQDAFIRKGISWA